MEDIDIACEKGLNYPMGPFRLMDLTGIDVTIWFVAIVIQTAEMSATNQTLLWKKNTRKASLAAKQERGGMITRNNIDCNMVRYVALCYL